MDCIFCRIVKNELPSQKVYEDDSILAFLDIAPVKHGHTLIIPKAHMPNFSEAAPDVLDVIMHVAQKVGHAVVSATDAEGYTLTTSNGRAAGQLIDHLHFHLIPRHSNDGLKLWPQAPYPAGEFEKMGEKIRQALG